MTVCFITLYIIIVIIVCRISISVIVIATLRRQHFQVRVKSDRCPRVYYDFAQNVTT